MSADDFSADLAELYGYVNRSMPDAELDGFVDALALRIASFDKQALRDTKHLVNLSSLPADSDISREWDAFIDSLQRPGTQARIQQLMERGFHKPGDVENRLGHYGWAAWRWRGRRAARAAWTHKYKHGLSSRKHSTAKHPLPFGSSVFTDCGRQIQPASPAPPIALSFLQSSARLSA